MSFFSEASLAMIPSGYKTSKVYSALPITGDGDLTFTRSNDTATRVGPDGLIEKVRTNLATYSNDFSDAAWAKSTGGVGITPVVTPNYTTDPFGGNNGWRLQCDLNGGTTSSDRSWLQQTIAGTTAPTTVSVYAKLNSAGTATFTVTNGSTDSFTITSTDWVRVSSVRTATPASYLFRIGLIGNNGQSDSIDISIAFAQLEVGDVMTDYIATTSAAVSVGPVANVPRLDYLGSSCPRLLLEPQRTNAITFSENFDNAAWLKSGSATTITANSTVSPSGYQDADTWTISAAGARYLSQTKTLTAGAVTASFFVKKGTSDWFAMYIVDGGSSAGFTFNVSDGTLGSAVSSSLTPTASIQDYGNGWYRCVLTATVVGTSIEVRGYVATSASTVSASVGASVICWGAQLEASASYPSSYVNTLGAAVTRGSESASKTGIASLIGQSEGTFFAEVTLLGNTGNFNVLNTENSSVNAITLHIEASQVRGYVYANSSLFNSIIGGSVSVGNTYKMAYAYKSGDAALYLNGVQIGTASQTWAFSASVDKIEVADPDTYFSYQEGIKFAQALLFPTRLSNADLAALTA